MTIPLNSKSTVDEIRQRFDGDVERFSRLETGQAATIDAPLALELITQAALAATPGFTRVLDLGCGAGNYTLALQAACGRSFAVDLLDLSGPMLERALARLAAVNGGPARAIQGDFRVVDLDDGAYDIVLAAAVLHHLRDDDDWRAAFAKLFRILAPGGSLWISDLVAHSISGVHDLMWRRYGAYLEALGGVDYRDRVFAYIDREDSPRPLCQQLELLRAVGFAQVEVLHKNGCFAAFGAVKG